MITICDRNFWQKSDDDNCVKLIAVVDKNFGISKNGSIPWSFKEDLLFFKKVTENRPVIMGRTTFFSIKNAPLPNRVNCVISKNEKIVTGAFVFDSPEAAIEKYRGAWIIGGEKIFNYALSHELVDYAVITQVNKNYNADTFLDCEKISDEKKFQKTVLFRDENLRYTITSYLRV